MMNIVKRPFYWISAHREATFTFEYEHTYALQGTSDSAGKVGFLFAGDGINSLSVGEYVFIDSGEYEGYHKVTEIFLSNLYITDTDYTIAQTSGNLTFIEDHVFSLWAGFPSGFPSELVDALPYHEIATFKPEPNLDGQLVVNISGYINKVFDVINSNDTITVGGLTVYPNLFNRIFLFIDDVAYVELRALNAAITQYELNRDYVGTGRSLNGGSLGNHYLSCGVSELPIIGGGMVILGSFYDQGNVEPVGADFDGADFNPFDFDTVGE